MKSETIIFSSTEHHGWLGGLPFAHGTFKTSRYINGELHIDTRTSVDGDECIIAGSIAPPDDNLLTVSMLAHTLKKDGAARVSAMLPYLGYSRHDRADMGESLGLAWAGKLLQASGVDEIISLDVHSPLDHDLLPMPLYSISPAGLLAREVTELRSPGITIVAPDQGAAKRVRDVAEAVGITQIIQGHKARSSGGVKVTIDAAVSDDIVVIDDILDGGDTLVACCEELKRLGAGKITIAVTHALFNGDHWKKLWDLNVTKLYCLDTVQPIPRTDPRIIVLPSGELINKFLRQRAKI